MLIIQFGIIRYINHIIIVYDYMNNNNHAYLLIMIYIRIEKKILKLYTYNI
jgi:hypothetical protein